MPPPGDSEKGLLRGAGGGCLQPRHREPVGFLVEGIGSTPACTGTPAIWFSHQYDIWVYPRVCGGTDGGLARANVSLPWAALSEAKSEVSRRLGA